MKIVAEIIRESTVRDLGAALMFLIPPVVTIVSLKAFLIPTLWILGLLFVASMFLMLDLLWKEFQVCREVALSDELTAIQLVQAWARLRFTLPRVRLIQYVTQRDLLAANEESQQMVSGLALLLERDLDRPFDKPGIEPCGDSEIDNWYQAYVETNKDRLRIWGMAALDELCRLEQKLSQSRRDQR